MFKYVFFIVIFSFNFLAFGQDCQISSTKGYVKSQTVPEFSDEQTTNWARTAEIIAHTKNLKSQDFDLFYEMASPYDPNKETIFIAGGFYPWVNLQFVTKGSLSDLAVKYNVFEIHWRGTGCSELPLGLAPELFTHEMLAYDLERVRLHLGIKKINSWSSSNGSFLMLMYSVLYPKSTGQIFLRDTAIYIPTLLESSKNFENNILVDYLNQPEFASFDYNTKFQFIKSKDIVSYNILLKSFGTIFFRKEQQRTLMLEVLEAAFILIQADNSSTLKTEITEPLLDSLNRVETWSHAELSNYCASTLSEDFSTINPDQVYVVDYVYHRCLPFQLKYKANLLSQLDFRGSLKNAHNFFVYQGYWDEYLYKELAASIATENKGSVLFIDKNIGHGEINQRSFSCFATILLTFFDDPASKVYLNYCK